MLPWNFHNSFEFLAACSDHHAADDELADLELGFHGYSKLDSFLNEKLKSGFKIKFKIKICFCPKNSIL